MMPSTPAENEFLKSLLNAGKQITLALPDDLDPKDVTKHIKNTCSLMIKAEISHDKLDSVLGRLLVIVRKNPEIYEKAGYDTFGQYLKQEVIAKFKAKRSNVYQAKRIMEHFGNLTIEQYGSVGTQKLLLLCKFTGQDDAGSAKLLKLASEKTFDEFKEFLEDKGYLGKDESTGASLTLKGSLAKIKELKRFLKRTDIQAAAESADPLVIILAMSQEVDADWTETGAKALQDKADTEAAE